MNFKNLLLPPVIWAVSVMGVFFLHEIAPIKHFDPTPWRTVPSLIIIALAIITTVWHKRLFKKERTNIDTFGKPDKLVESGFFKWSRNPMYLGFVVSLAALAFLGGALSTGLVVVAFFVLVDRWHIPYEEKEMQSQFGGAYAEYRARTRRWI